MFYCVIKKGNDKNVNNFNKYQKPYNKYKQTGSSNKSRFATKKEIAITVQSSLYKVLHIFGNDLLCHVPYI